MSIVGPRPQLVRDIECRDKIRVEQEKRGRN